MTRRFLYKLTEAGKNTCISCGDPFEEEESVVKGRSLNVSHYDCDNKKEEKG